MPEKLGLMFGSDGIASNMLGLEGSSGSPDCPEEGASGSANVVQFKPAGFEEEKLLKSKLVR